VSLAVGALLAGCSGRATAPEQLQTTFFSFDTVCTVGGLMGQETLDALVERCQWFEKHLSRTIATSDVGRINAAGGAPVEVEPETAEVIRAALGYSRDSGGLFDITIGKASALWDFHEAEDVSGDESAAESLLPDEADLADAVKHVDYRQVAVNGLSVKLADPDMEIDLGGIAKGYIADRVTEFLEERGVVSAVVDLGGNIVAIGGKTSGLLAEDAPESESVFNIGIKDPQSETGALLAVFPAHDKTVVTSGTYERFLIQDGVKYHHILDPATGWPINNDVLSVTIIAPKGSAADADGLSTTCLALGVEKGMDLIESLAYMGVEAVFVDAEGEIHKTAGAPELTTG
jgi:thiamine biosynthesis lipoprotein